MSAQEHGQPVQPVQPLQPVTSEGDSETGISSSKASLSSEVSQNGLFLTQVPNRGALDEVREWLGRYIVVMHDRDLDLMALWTAHTYLVHETYSTVRLIFDSPVHGSGKTTAMEHLKALSRNPVLAAQLSSPALLPRMLAMDMWTVLIDEADRSLNPDKPETAELLAILNSGYKASGSRPVLVPSKGGGWDVQVMSTFCPVAMAGNNPNLPEDTRSRSVRVLLMPDTDGEAEESEWQAIEGDAQALAGRLAAWCDQIRGNVRAKRPALPEGIRGRSRERWGPLKRVAVEAGGRWPAVVDELALLQEDELRLEKEEGLISERPHIALLRHMHEVWPAGEVFVSTEALIDKLVWAHPEMWGVESSFGKRLTAQRLGRMMVGSYKIHTSRPDSNGPRGYGVYQLAGAFSRFGLDPQNKPARPAEPAEPAVVRPPLMLVPGDEPPPDDDPGPETCSCRDCGEPLRPEQCDAGYHPECVAS